MRQRVHPVFENSIERDINIHFVKTDLMSSKTTTDEPRSTGPASFRNGLLSILACPGCKGSLIVRAEPATVHCENCRLEFPIATKNGHSLPVLFPSTSRHIADLGIKHYIEADDVDNYSNYKRVFKKNNQALTALLRKLGLPNLIDFFIKLPWRDPHQDFADAAARRYGFFGPAVREKILCIGSGGRVLRHMIALDIAPHENVDVVADAHALPFADECLDAVYVSGVSEHLEKPWVAVEEIYRVLKPGGVVSWTAPFLYYNHGVPGDYFRFTRGGIRVLFEKFQELELDVNMYQFSSILYQINIAITFSIPNFFIRTIVGTLLNYVFWPFRILDRFMIGSKNRFTLAGSLYYVGQKP